MFKVRFVMVQQGASESGSHQSQPKKCIIQHFRVTINYQYQTMTINKYLIKDYSKTTQRLLKDYSKTDQRLLKDYSKTAQRLLKDYSKTTQRLLETTSKLLKDYSKATQRLLQYYPKTEQRLLQDYSKTSTQHMTHPILEVHRENFDFVENLTHTPPRYGWGPVHDHGGGHRFLDARHVSRNHSQHHFPGGPVVVLRLDAQSHDHLLRCRASSSGASLL
jgi:hypothetical protein